MLILVLGPKAQVRCRILPAQNWCHRVIWVCSRRLCHRFPRPRALTKSNCPPGNPRQQRANGVPGPRPQLAGPPAASLNPGRSWKPRKRCGPVARAARSGRENPVRRRAAPGRGCEGRWRVVGVRGRACWLIGGGKGSGPWTPTL